MTKLFIEDSSLTAIGDAIRAKTGGTELLSPSGMATAIAGIETGGGGGEIPEEALVLTGYCDNKFSGGWDWFLDSYGKKITTKDLESVMAMFKNCSQIETIPFDFNFSLTPTMGYHQCNSVFSGCSSLSEIKGSINNLCPYNLSEFFYSCTKLRRVPEFNNLDMSYIANGSSLSCSYMFYGCCSLRSIPEELLKQLCTPKTTRSNYSIFYSGFGECHVIDEIRGLNPQTSTMTSNAFYNTFANNYRIKDIIFASQEDGTPYTCSWKGQTITLSNCIGWWSVNYIHNSSTYGMDANKRVTDDTTYAALKNDPDWFTTDPAYSRYNHDSAVNTINSLPDTSAYLAGTSGTNTIAFYGKAGSKTDGGAINTLTEEEIAVAAAKGWTVTFA